MVNTKISVLLATIGKPCLARALEGFSKQAWGPEDELVVVSDGNHEVVDSVCLASNIKQLRRVSVAGGPYKDWGHTPRNLTMHTMRGDYICHFDDDDLALPDMLKNMHSVLTEIPSVHMFRYWKYKTERLVWTKYGCTDMGQVSTQNILHPNLPKTFGHWGLYYGGDCQFIRETCNNFPDNVHFHDIITCVYAPPAEFNARQIIGWYLQKQRAAARRKRQVFPHR